MAQIVKDGKTYKRDQVSVDATKAGALFKTVAQGDTLVINYTSGNKLTFKVKDAARQVKDAADSSKSKDSVSVVLTDGKLGDKSKIPALADPAADATTKYKAVSYTVGNEMPTADQLAAKSFFADTNVIVNVDKYHKVTLQGG